LRLRHFTPELEQEMAEFHVVIVDSHVYDFGDAFVQERAVWEGMGARVTLARCETAGDVIAAGREADILAYVGLYTPFDAAVLAQLPRCQLIARYGIGMDSVDLAAATAEGIIVANAAEYCVPEVADHATALILSLARRITQLDRFVRGGQWGGAPAHVGPIPRLSTQTVGLVGFGRIARRVADNLRPMFGTLLAYDPFVSQAQADSHGARMVTLDELLAAADYVSVHTPLLPQTRGLIGAAQLARMKRTAYLVNTSRGPVVDEAALADALAAGQIAGAGLDVFDPEPLVADSPLREMDQVILTPHMAANSVQALEDLRLAVTETVAAVMRGEWPRHVMNPKVTPRRALRRV
jgi:D-3-phosphoglycerate dehydrogenase